jgi:hypothetical protein
MMKADFPPQEAIEVWDPVNRQDWEICKRVQQGVQARVHEFGYHTEPERASYRQRRAGRTTVVGGNSVSDCGLYQPPSLLDGSSPVQRLSLWSPFVDLPLAAT